MNVFIYFPFLSATFSNGKYRVSFNRLLFSRFKERSYYSRNTTALTIYSGNDSPVHTHTIDERDNNDARTRVLRMCTTMLCHVIKLYDQRWKFQRNINTRS